MMSTQNLTRVQKKTFLGLTLYEKFRSENQIVRYLAGGLWREEVSFSSYGESDRQVYFLSLPIFGRHIDKKTISWHFGRNTTFYNLSIEAVLEDKLNQLFPSQLKIDQRRHVFVLWANSGEIAIFLSIFMPRLLVKMRISSEEVVLLCTKPYHADMASLFFPEIKTVVAKPKVLRYVTEDLKTKTWDVNVFFTGAYFCEFERQAHRSKSPHDCINWMANFLKLPPLYIELTDELNKKLDKFEESADRKLGEKKDWSNTILISPNSFSCGNLSAEDTATIHDIVVERGYDVFFNEATGSRALSFPELLSKVRHSVGIIGIRSGLMDFLSCAHVPMFICYRSFQDRGFNTPACNAETVLKMFSLRRLDQSSYITETLSEPNVDLKFFMHWLDSL